MIFQHHDDHGGALLLQFLLCDSLPLMTGVNTAMPTKFGLVTVLSRIKPPTLENINDTTINESVGGLHTCTINSNLRVGHLVAGAGEKMNQKMFCVTVNVNGIWSSVLHGVPADGHGDDDRLPARIEEFSGGGDLPGNQHPQRAQRHKNRTHQWAGVVIVFCVGIKKKKNLGLDNRVLNGRKMTLCLFSFF